MAKRDEGSILKAADGKRWNARLRYTDRLGNKREKKRTCISYAAAKSMIATLRAEVESELTDRKTYAQADAFYRKNYVHAARFVGGKMVSGFRQKLVAVEHYLDASLAFFGDQYLDEISYDDLRRFKKSVMDRPVVVGETFRVRSISDTNQFLKRLRRVLNVAIEQGWIAVNPFKRGGSLIRESFEVERTRTLSPAEESLLIAKCTGRRKHLVPVIIFAIETGCRRGEIQKLRWRDVNLKGRVIKIDSSNTKTLKSRLVPISARLRETLAQLRQNQLRPNSPVFGNADFKRSFAGACDDAGLVDVHFHDLRHTAITRMLEAGISPPLVMKISGHSQQKTFLRYVNQSEQSVYEIALKLDAAA